MSCTDHENFYEGRVFGEKMSDVSAHLEDGVMTATIHTPDDTYHIEVKIKSTLNSSSFSLVCDLHLLLSSCSIVIIRGFLFYFGKVKLG